MQFLGKKAKPFETSFGALGVEYNLKDLHEGRVSVGNKQERLDRIGRMVSKVSCDGAIKTSTAASIHGLLNFASGFTVGKALQVAAQGFSTLASGLSLSRSAVQNLCDHTLIVLEALGPREVALPIQSSPVVIYADGAYEGTAATWGAIVLDPVTDTRLCFSGVVPEFLRLAWRNLVGEH